jgi:hypothetical protein
VKSTSTRNSKNRPSVTSLKTPIYHRLRRDWRDDQYLIEDIVKFLDSKHCEKANDPTRIKEFKEITGRIAVSGYQSNIEALCLAMWIRENLVRLSHKHGGYDLRVHAFEIPDGLIEIIQDRCEKFASESLYSTQEISLEHLFPDTEVRLHALQRVQLLHKGDLHAYLHALVRKEKDSLVGESATIKDLIHICEEKLCRRNLRVVSNYAANEVDLWAPALSLGIEVRDALSLSDTEDLVGIFRNTKSSKKTRFLALVCPDDLSDLMFHNWKKLENHESMENLSVLRVGDLGVYLDKIAEMIA